MLIGFTSAELRKIFNHGAQLEAEYGRRLAKTIKNRMAILGGAPHLGLVPDSPPINLRMFDAVSATFCVSLFGPRLLLFQGLPRRRPRPELSAIQEIEILDVQ